MPVTPVLCCPFQTLEDAGFPGETASGRKRTQRKAHIDSNLSLHFSAGTIYVRAITIRFWWWITTAIAVVGSATAVPIAPCFKFESLFEFCN
jgi:hypothetical protein